MQLTNNEHGEIVGFGPIYACHAFGRPGHDYHTCKQCRDRFELRLQKLGVAR